MKTRNCSRKILLILIFLAENFWPKMFGRIFFWPKILLAENWRDPKFCPNCGPSFLIEFLRNFIFFVTIPDVKSSFFPKIIENFFNRC